MSSGDYDAPDEPGTYWVYPDAIAPLLGHWDGYMWTYTAYGTRTSTNDDLAWELVEIPEPYEIEGGA